MYEITFTALKRPPRLATVCFVVAQGKQFWVCLQLILFGLAIHEAATRGVYSFLEKYIPLPASFSFWSGPT